MEIGVLVQIGTQVIDQLVATMAKKEIAEGWGNLETGTPWHHCLQKNTVKGLDDPEYNFKGET